MQQQVRLKAQQISFCLKAQQEFGTQFARILTMAKPANTQKQKKKNINNNKEQKKTRITIKF